MPTNKALESVQSGTQETRALIVKWNGLHAVRTCLGALATVAFLWASVSI